MLQKNCESLRNNYDGDYFSRVASLQQSIFKKAGHAYGMTKKGHILINLGQFENETPLSRMRI